MRILVTDGMDKTAMAQLREAGHEVVEQFYEPDQLGAALREFDAVVVRSKTKVRANHIDEAKGGKLKLIIRGGVGVDNIDVKYAEANGITVKNTPKASSQSVAELAMGHMFSCARYLSIAGHTMREGKWEKKAYGKGMSYGGSLIRPEATGYGAVYYLQEVLKHENDTIEGKRLAISGYGNVGWGIMKKAAELGAKVTYFAGPDGYIHDPDGVTGEKLDYILEMRAKDPMHCKPYADKYGVEFVAGEKCWGVKDVDVYMPAATQNDVRMESAEKIAASGVKYYIEVANMPTTNDALNFLRAQKHMVVAPSKAVNAGGVGVSGLEMSQNSERLSWTAEEVDAQLHKMMKNIHKVSAEAAEEYGLGYDLVAGANIAGFKKVAEAMYEQGVF